jgi:hypothetical protein
MRTKIVGLYFSASKECEFVPTSDRTGQPRASELPDTTYGNLL